MLMDIASGAERLGRVLQLPDDRSLARRLLSRAAQQVVAGIPADVAPSDLADSELPVAQIVGMVDAVLDEKTPRASMRVVQVHRTTLATLRRTALEHTEKAQGLAEVRAGIRVLSAIEQVHVLVERAVTANSDFERTETGALGLVIEMAHDMRSPLTSILFLVEALRRGHGGVVNAVQERQLGLVYSAAFGLSSLANDVTELAHGGERLLDPNPGPFSLLEVLQGVRDIVQPIAEEKGLTVHVSSPDADARLGQPAALSRVLLNLTINALKFTETGRVDVAFRAVSRTRVECSVSDTGRGIPQGIVETLFDTFRRVTGRGCSFSNAGLGLSICRKLVVRMGGELKVDTAPGRGTRFHFELDLPPVARF